MTKAEIINFSDTELKDLLLELTKKKVEYTFLRGVIESTDISSVRKIKKDIARINTELRKRELLLT